MKCVKYKMLFIQPFQKKIQGLQILSVAKKTVAQTKLEEMAEENKS